MVFLFSVYGSGPSQACRIRPLCPAQDIPGVESGRPVDRIDDLLPVLPKGIKTKIKRRMLDADRKAKEKADQQQSKLPGGDADRTGAEK